MSYIYPREKLEPELVPISDEAVVVVRIIVAREAGFTKEQSVGPALKGSDDVAIFEKLWKEVEEERLAFRAVNPAKCSTQTAYLTELGKLTRWLDAGLFLNGLKAEVGVGTWADLKAAFTPEIL